MADEQDDLGALVDALVRGRGLDSEIFQRLFPPDFAHRTLTRVEQLRAMLAEREDMTGPDLQPGDTLVDVLDGDPNYPLHTPLGQHPRYGLGELLGAGGVAEVYQALDRRLGRAVALKALRPEIAQQRRNRQRFIAESQTTARLAHPGIIPVHDAGKLADGRLFFTMQRVEGRTLRAVIDALQKRDVITEGQFPLPRLLSIFHRVCMTVAYAHDQGVIHRDLKPENILLGPYGEVYVADWGLSRPFDEEAAPDERLTREGEAIGTLYYMAPEQACGELDEQGPGIDIWALGVILYELLALDRPFVGRSIINLVYVIATDPPRPIHEVVRPGRALPDPLVELIDAALIKEVAQRTLSARQMAERVAAWLDGVESDRRKRAEARALLERARAEERRFRVQHGRARTLDDTLRAVRDRLAIDADETTRDDLWRRQEACRQQGLDAERLRVHTIELALQSIDVWETDEAHQLVADLCWARARELRARGDATGAMPFEGLARRHDRGRLADEMAPDGRLEVARGTGSVRILAQTPLGPLRADTPIESGDGRLPVGSYVVQVATAGRMTARVPIVIGGNRVHRLRVVPPPAEFEDEWCYIQGGRARLGGDPLAPLSLADNTFEFTPFLIGRHPITARRYRRFVADSGHPAPAGLAAAADDAPVGGIRLSDARAYCSWRSMRDGAAIRLPTEAEWEYVARGVDGRRFPWGDGFDPSLCLSAAEPSDGPGAVGSKPRDRSPFGVMDLAGRISEWTASPADRGIGHYVVRGGSHRDAPRHCRAAARRFVPSDAVRPTIGFRIVRVIDNAVGRGSGPLLTVERPR